MGLRDSEDGEKQQTTGKNLDSREFPKWLIAFCLWTIIEANARGLYLEPSRGVSAKAANDLGRRAPAYFAYFAYAIFFWTLFYKTWMAYEQTYWLKEVAPALAGVVVATSPTCSRLAPTGFVFLSLYNTWRLLTRGPKPGPNFVDVDGKLVVVTGSNAGIGKSTAYWFAMRNSKVVLAVRNVKAGSIAAEDIKKRSGNPNIFVEKLDLSSFDSVERFVDSMTEKYDHSVDFLINNAGLMKGSFTTTAEDGLETCFQVNFAATIYLCVLMLPLMSVNSRITNVSSSYCRMWCDKHGGARVGDPEMKKEWPGRYSVYGHSKHLLNVGSMKLAQLCLKHSIKVNCLNPGTIKSGIVREYPKLVQIAQHLIFFCQKTNVSGAYSTIHCSASVDVGTGGFYENCRRARVPEITRDPEEISAVWKMLEDRLSKRERFTVGIQSIT